ncbi:MULTISPECIES: hypothetical protein [unclassified Streptomyces]|uniref:hypothetical protein n=1 Tax=unclassified Streptomyces TaxID=2593676 RepID=UPI001CA5183C|nr:hypothetical protein [Streptomyces sp. SM10]
MRKDSFSWSDIPRSAPCAPARCSQAMVSILSVVSSDGDRLPEGSFLRREL